MGTMKLSVVMPSVPERESERALTLAQLAAVGISPRVLLPSLSESPCPATHGRMAWRLLRAALREHSDWPVLFVEDDVDFAPDLAEALGLLIFGQALTPIDVPVTLYLPGRRFYPSAVRRRLSSGEWGRSGALEVYPVVNLAHWYGSQALFLPASLASALIAEPPPPEGFDGILRGYLLANRIPLLCIVPNLAQHRSPPSVTSRRYQPHRSLAFGGR